ncbi:MAG TPA: hypothetical protein VFA50_16175 [Stellaceae bacterium]|nr:hypothetical protein [Stellaceae bacterium]
MKNLLAHIHAAWPRHAAKEIARAEGCSIATGKRIAATGAVPVGRRRRFLGRLAYVLGERLVRIARLRREVRAELRDDTHAHHRGF